MRHGHLQQRLLHHLVLGLIVCCNCIAAIAAVAADAWKRWTGAAGGAVSAQPAHGRGCRPDPPSNVALVFAEVSPESISLRTVANLAYWCADLGIDYIWIFDPSGHLKRSQALVEAAVAAVAAGQRHFSFCAGWPRLAAQSASTARRPVPPPIAPPQDGQQPTRPPQQLPCTCRSPTCSGAGIDCSPPASGEGGPGASGPRITIHLLGAEDAFPPVLALACATTPPNATGAGAASACVERVATWQPTARRGCQVQLAAPAASERVTEPQCCSAKHHEGSQQQAPHMLLQQQQQQQQQQLPPIYQDLAAVAGPAVLQPPQLMLVLGEVLCLAGYPPFHTRAAEVIHVGPSSTVSRDTLQRAVAQYCSALQRHGR